MSAAALRLFRVRVMVARTLTRAIVAADADKAAAIGEYLFSTFGDRHFTCDPEEIFDTDVEVIPEAAP